MSLKIGNIEITDGLVLAPLAGYTDVAFRQLCIEQGASLTVTEMISAKGLNYGSAKTREMLCTSSVESPSCVQLFGHDPIDFVKAFEKTEELAHFDIIDINMGCPMAKVTNNGEGSALMRDPVRASEIVCATVQASKRPVTVKMRMGWDSACINAVEFAREMERSGASAVTVHGRTRTQMYSGQADYDIVAEVKAALHIPVLLSGDVTDTESYTRALATGADGVMIGRGAVADPSIFQRLRGGQSQDKYSLISRHIDLMEKYFPERYVVTAIRKFFGYYLKGERGMKEFKVKVNCFETIEQLRQGLKQAFNR